MMSIHDRNWPLPPVTCACGLPVEFFIRTLHETECARCWARRKRAELDAELARSPRIRGLASLTPTVVHAERAEAVA